MEKQTTKKEKKKTKVIFISRCLICILLVLTLTVLAMPQTVNAFADAIHEKESIAVSSEEEIEEFDPQFETEFSPEVEEKERYIEFEDIKKRTEYEKHYYMSDGTYMSETYAEPIHYKDVNGKMQDIDNSLVEYTKNGEQKIKNAKNSFSAEFAVDLSLNSPVFSLNKDEYKLDLFLDTEFNDSEQNNPLLLDIALDKEDSLTTDSKDDNANIPLDKGTLTGKTPIAKAEFNKADKFIKEETFSYKNKKLTQGINNNRLTSELKYKKPLAVQILNMFYNLMP